MRATTSSVRWILNEPVGSVKNQFSAKNATIADTIPAGDAEGAAHENRDQQEQRGNGEVDVEEPRDAGDRRDQRDRGKYPQDRVAEPGHQRQPSRILHSGAYCARFGRADPAHRRGGRRSARSRSRRRARRAARRRRPPVGRGRAAGRASRSPRARPTPACCSAGPAPARRSPRTRSPGVRAALCTDAETAAGARRWNDANVLVMSLRLTSPRSPTRCSTPGSRPPRPREAANIATLETRETTRVSDRMERSVESTRTAQPE